MKIKKFQAADMRDALAQIKRTLGADAMVVSTRKVRRGLLGIGVEVTAAIDSDEGVDELPEVEPVLPRASTSNGLAESDVERIMAPLRSELRSLRSLIRASADNRGSDDIRGEIAALRQVLAGAGHATAAEPSVEQLAADHQITAVSQGRVVTLVGPTGVGKTTTIAKLAGRAALVDKEKIAIISLDTYRVGGEDQIRILADLIGVPLYMASDASRLQHALAACADADRVFIDTAGRSPRDESAIAAMADALNVVDDIEIHLAMCATTSPRDIDGIYRRFGPLRVDSLLFTKLDEAEDLGELVRAPARLGRPVTWVTTGQRIPEDIEDARTEELVALASGRRALAFAA